MIITYIIFELIQRAVNEWHERECGYLSDDPEGFNDFKRDLHDATLNITYHYNGGIEGVYPPESWWSVDSDTVVFNSRASWYPETYQDWAELPSFGGIHPMDNPNNW